MTGREDWSHLEPSDSSSDYPPERLTQPDELKRLLALQSVPPTASLAEDVVKAEDVISRGGVDGWHTRAEANQRNLQGAQSRLQEGRQRDELAAGRPDGCTCLGAGGRQATYRQDGSWTFRTYCSCPDGVALRQLHLEQDSAAAEKLSKRRAQQRLADFVEQLPYHFCAVTLDTFPARVSAQKTALATVRNWAVTDESDERKPWLLLRGPYGVGKTCLAIAAARARIGNRLVHSATFTPVPDLLDRIRATFEREGRHEREADVMEELRNVDLLVLDDLGAENTTSWAVERLFTLLNHRHAEHMGTIITTNLDAAGMADRLGERITWRIAEMAEVVSLEKCPNLRARALRVA